MKKIFNVIIFIISVLIVLNFSMMVTAEYVEPVYTVYSINKDGLKTQIGEATTDYSVAENLMNNYSNSITDVAVIYKDDRLINAYYGIVKLKDTTIAIYSPETKNLYTYTHGSYGKDAAFLGYDNTDDLYKIRISGYTGFISSGSAEIIPLSSLATNYVMINAPNVYLYSGINGYTKKTLQHRGSYIYIEKKEENGSVWYHLSETGIDGWVKGESVTEEIRPFINTFYVNFNYEDNNRPWYLYHQFEYSNGNYNLIDLGVSPSYLNKNEYYYSFDGNYFYNDFIKMLVDYKNNNFDNSINKNDPHFNYYMYLPNHSLSSYSKEDLDNFISISYNAKPDKSYVDENGNFVKPLENNLSQLYNEGSSFLETQEKYGINALLTLGVAKNESANGRSAIAIAKNNLFGHNAVDSSPFKSAITYETVKDSIVAHATVYMQNYIYPNGSYYYGGHYGNKGSGMNVKYATDPYWGEKMAKYAFLVDNSIAQKSYVNKLTGVSAVVGQDYLSNTVGIKLLLDDIPVKLSASNDCKTLYTLKNNTYNIKVSNMPLIVVGKVESDNKIWYKIRTDVGIDENGNTTSEYNFDTSYGYILSDYLYVNNNAPTITGKNIVIEQGNSIDLLDGVVATDKEDGDITKKITYVTNLNTNEAGIYNVVYSVADSSNFVATASYEIKVNIMSKPVINASDIKIRQYDNIDLLENVTASDSIDGDITSNIKIVSSNLDNTKIGKYQVTYSVVNSLNVTTSKTITIEVSSNESPVIYASDIYIEKNSIITYLENVQSRDLEDGLLNVSILSNTTDITKVGTYDLTYAVKDSNNNETTKNVKVYVEDYEKLKGEFYFNTLKWDNDKNLLDITGSLAMTGIDNTKDIEINYYLILKNDNGYEINLPLERYLENHPTTVYADTKNKYLETWFKGSVSLSSVPKGEYTLYIKAVSGKYMSKELVSNIFLKEYTKKIVDKFGRGYLLRNNNYVREFPLELIVTDNGLITTIESSHPSNMFNTYDSIIMKDNYLNIIGNSFNMGVDYSKDKDVVRYLILENVSNEKQYVYNIGSIIGNNLILKGDDGLSKVKSWYDTTNKIDISNLEKGTYIIYLRTKVDNVDDFGELQDILLKTNQTIEIDNKVYTLSVNKQSRYRVELQVE